MIVGFALLVLGYAVWYWGAHHFCNFDCPQQSPSGTGVGGCCNNRVSLLDCLGVPSKWGVSKGTPVQLTGDINSQNNAQQPAGGGGSNPPGQTQPQQGNNQTTPGPLAANNPGLKPGGPAYIPSSGTSQAILKTTPATGSSAAGGVSGGLHIPGLNIGKIIKDIRCGAGFPFDIGC